MKDNFLPLSFINTAMDSSQEPELMLSTEGIATPYGETLQEVLDSCLHRINDIERINKILLLNLVYESTRTIPSDEELSIDIKLSSKNSIPVLKIVYAIDVATGETINLQSNIIGNMNDEKKATLFLYSKRTTLCSIRVYEYINQTKEN